jgi:hypothetical protein
MDIRAVVELVKQTPQVQQAVDIIEAQLSRAPIMPEDLDEMIKMLEAVVEDPNRYPEVRAAAIQDGIINEQEAPAEYDPQFVLAVLVALYGYRDRLNQQGYARGGLRVAARKLQSAGRGGDSMLAHINPREAEMLRRMGGAGTVNPNTGLREYKSGGDILGAILPVALNFIAPGLGTAIGGAMGFTGTAAAVVGSAVIGGTSAALTGQDPLKGAVLGGLGGGLGQMVGGAANNALGLNLGAAGQNILGGALVGGGTSALTGGDFLTGAFTGGAGSLVGQLAGANTLGGATGAGVSAAGRDFGNMIVAGYDPKTAAISGGLSGLATGIMHKPSDAALDSLKQPEQQMVKTLTGETVPAPGSKATIDGKTGQYTLDPKTGVVAFKPDPGSYAINPQTQAVEWKANEPGFMQRALQGGPLEKMADAVSQTADTSSFGMKDIGTLAVLSSLAQQRPPEANQAIEKMSPQQQEYFNRPNVKWDWNKMQADANSMNMSLTDYMATYWPQITSGTYNTQTPMAMGGMYAMGGGPMGAVARLVRGGGSGRDDTINARLSDGEYVMDAETVAMLGDGSTDEGARRLDTMRNQLRKHKGKTMARGKFSPNAKSPLAYLKGAA